MGATLTAIAAVDPGAWVDVAIFSEAWNGGMLVDGEGVPLDWDIPTDTCAELGLTCTQAGDSRVAQG